MAVQFDKTKGAHFKKVAIPVSTKTNTAGGEKRESTLETEVPASLADAIKAEGEQKVYKRYLQALGIDLQGEKRRELQEKRAGEKKRAGWMEELVDANS
jgi:hypothetical protein